MSRLDFSQYQRRAASTAFYPHVNEGGHPLAIAYCIMKLNGESGECAEAVGKFFRSEGYVKLTREQRKKLADELGDVLWYISALANELGIRLESVAAWNLEKLAARAERGPILSDGWEDEAKAGERSTNT
jgi:NTP pyrophosphatase (non-canonical NTP hydrolase)